VLLFISITGVEKRNQARHLILLCLKPNGKLGQSQTSRQYASGCGSATAQSNNENTNSQGQ